MTPRSRMVFFVGALMAAPLLAQAAEEWRSIYTHSQTYFVGAADIPKLDQMRAGKADGFLPLSIEVVSKGVKTKAKSEAELSCVKGKCEVVGDRNVLADQNIHGSYGIPVDARGNRGDQRPASVEAAKNRPAGVSESVWNVVANSGILAANWPKAAQALELLKKQKPQAYAKMAGGERKFTYNAILAELNTGVGRNQSTEQLARAAEALAEEKGKIAAAPPAPAPTAGPAPAPAATANAPLATAAVAEEPAGAPDADKTKAAFAALIEQFEKKPKFKEALKAKFTAYVMTPTGKDGYIDGPEEKMLTMRAEVAAGIATWVDEQAKSKDGRGKAAVLYFALGESKEKLKELGAHPNLVPMSNDMPFRADFGRRMKACTVGGPADQVPGQSKPGPYPYVGDKKWLLDFPMMAVQFAADAMNTGNVTKKEFLDSIIKQDGSPTDLPGQRTGGDPRAPGSFSGRSFGFNELYDEFPGRGGPKGAKVMYLPIPGTKEFRKISFRIESQPTDFGPPQKPPEDKIAIFDISEPPTGASKGNVFGQYFPLNGGKAVFRLDDRPGHGDSVKYVLSVNNGVISFQSLDSKTLAPAGGGSVSVNDLYERRRRQVDEDGYPVTMNGQTFRVMGTGGFFGSLQYYAADENGRVKGSCGGSDYSGCTPALISLVTRVGASGGTEVTGDKAGLGYIMGADGKYQGYNLAWKSDINMFEAEKADKPADYPKPPPKPVTPPAAGTTPAAPAGAPTAPAGSPAPSTASPAAAAPTGAAALTNCKFKNESQYPKGFSLTVDNAPYRGDATSDPLTVFSDKSGKPTDANSSYVCLLTNRALVVSGVIGKGGVKISGGNIVLDVVVPAPNPVNGAVFLSPAELASAEVKDGELVADGKTLKTISRCEQYIIPTDGLQARMGEEVLWHVEKMASAHINNELCKKNAPKTTNDIVIGLLKGDDVVARTMKAVDAYGQGTICGEQRPAILAYIEKAAKVPELEARYALDVKDNDNKGGPTAAPQATVKVTCKVPKEIGAMPQTVVSPSWLTGSSKNKPQLLQAKDGKILPSPL